MTWRKGDTYTLATLGWLRQGAGDGISDSGGISLSLADANTVGVTFTKPDDSDFASAILYRRTPGDPWSAVHTFTDSGNWTDAVEAETTYIYVAVPKDSRGVNGPPTREAAIRTVTSATVSGLYSIPVDALRTLVANCPAAQSFLGVDNEADALAKIYAFIAGDVAEGAATSTSTGKLADSAATFVTNGVLAGDKVKNLTDKTETMVTSVDSETQLTLADDRFTKDEAYVVQVARPLIVIGLPEAAIGHERIAERTYMPNEGNELEVLFEKDISSGNEGAGKQADAWYSFTNEVGAIADEMLQLAGVDDGSHVYLPLRELTTKTGPGRPSRDEAEANIGHCYSVILSVRWD